MRGEILKHSISACLLALLTGCTTVPPAAAPPSEAWQPPQPMTASPSSAPITSPQPLPPASDTSAAVAVPPLPPASSPSLPLKSRLAAFIARRLHRQVETPVAPPAVPTEAEAAPPPEALVDEKYRLTGEAALELERGHASWYAPRFHGRRTANGENYDKYALTAAHRTLPFGTIVRVRSLALGREVDVRINDRGPFAADRVIDVSQAAAEVLGLTNAGVAEVTLNVDDVSSLRGLVKKNGKASRRSRGKGAVSRHR